ncbi:MAG: DeoR/GlpR family DNA-binding transcription regulator [Sphaerochaetaceae bacterium]|nr:DeoR/GlpR family DNA-binding transcription regulator [Sphaerochaetaceae bacterium]
MIPAQRQKQIISMINQDGNVQVSSLAKAFGVSELTIRRDLKVLSDSGLLERKFGGAILERSLSQEPEYSKKASEFMAEKKAIARMASLLVEDGDTVCVNSGSTTACVIQALIASLKKITIITNNIDAITMAMKTPMACTLIFTGGIYRERSRSVSGPMSALVLDNIWASKSFIGVDGFSLKHGLTTPIYEEAITTRTMIERTSGMVYVVATANKLGVVSNYKTVDAQSVDAIITDRSGAALLEGKEGLPEVIMAD